MTDPTMPKLLASARGTVQGVISASRHVLWYVNWQTRAPSAARDTSKLSG